MAVGCFASADPPKLDHVSAANRKLVGQGAYLTAVPPHERGPSNFAGLPVAPKVSDDFDQPATSNTWWSSLIWQFDAEGKANAFSAPLFPHPLAAQAQPRGLALGYPDRAEVKDRSFFFPFQADLLIGVDELQAQRTTVAGYGDWTVTAEWKHKAQPEGSSSARVMQATLGHGLPYVHTVVQGGDAQVHALHDVELWHDKPGAMGLTINGHHYGVFAPSDARWVRHARTFSSSLAGRKRFSVALLPDRRPETLELFRKHAHAAVKDSRVSWKYDEANAQLKTTFTSVVENPEAVSQDEGLTLMALYPHQWQSTDAALLDGSYVSARGPMKLVKGNAFSTKRAFHGILPVLPAPEVDDEFFKRDDLIAAIRADLRRKDLFPAGPEQTRGTYWTGKSLMRVAQLAWMADQVGDEASRDRAVGAIKAVMENWFDGQLPDAFFYHAPWGTLIGTPSEYRSGWELNDHHFHYAYYVFAAATLARFLPSWAQSSAYGGMVDMLMKDCANADRDDKRFPFLRHFDAYAGHSWANGPSLFQEGNNQESSSEDANFAVATFLWGALTQRPELRDLGIFLYTNLVAAIEQYWFDVDRQTFPPEFGKPVVAIVWGSGGKYDTWWDRNPIYVHGINMLPFSAGSVYLGYRPDFVKRNYESLLAANKGPVLLWRDIMWMYLALTDAQQASQLYSANRSFEPEFGNTHAFLYHWIGALRGLGNVNTNITASAPSYGVFGAGAQTTYAAFNPTAQTQRIVFSDGTKLKLKPFALKTRKVQR